jgi:hypothetical protein
LSKRLVPLKSEKTGHGNTFLSFKYFYIYLWKVFKTGMAFVTLMLICLLFSRQLSTSSVASTTTSSFEINSDDTKLKEFYQHLSYVLDRKISNEEILREIRRATKELEQHKVSYSGLCSA